MNKELELQELLAAVGEGLCTEVQAVRLVEMLRGSKAARRTYIHYMAMRADLTDMATRAEMAAEPVAIAPPREDERRVIASEASETPGDKSNNTKPAARWAALAGGIVAATMAAVFAFSWWVDRAGRGDSPKSPPRLVAAAPEVENNADDNSLLDRLSNNGIARTDTGDFLAGDVHGEDILGPETATLADHEIHIPAKSPPLTGSGWLRTEQVTFVESDMRGG